MPHISVRLLADRIPNRFGTTSVVTGHKNAPRFCEASCGPDPESVRDDLRRDRAQKKLHIINVKLTCGPDPESVRDDLRRDRAQKCPTFL